MSKLYGPFGIIGRTLVLHINEDDGGVHSDSGSLSSGNSGLRVACGIIGISWFDKGIQAFFAFNNK